VAHETGPDESLLYEAPRLPPSACAYKDETASLRTVLALVFPVVLR